MKVMQLKSQPNFLSYVIIVPGTCHQQGKQKQCRYCKHDSHASFVKLMTHFEDSFKTGQDVTPNCEVDIKYNRR